MYFGEASRRTATGLLDLLAPCQCDLCGAASRRDIDLCIPCEGELPWLVNACIQCALPLAGSGPVCGACLRSPPAFDRCIAALSYTQPVSQWIHEAKYKGDFSRLAILADLTSRTVAAALEIQPTPDVLVPMPLHWRRRWRRGFNQAEVLATRLSGHSRLADHRLRVDNKLCRRNKPTPPQQGLDADQRRRNLQGAFHCGGNLDGAVVAIVDDVVTTGSSATELARTLKSAGASSVSLWCCARTLR